MSFSRLKIIIRHLLSLLILMGVTLGAWAGVQLRGISSFTYDDLGRIVENQRGGEGGTLTTGYTLHGSVSSICSGAFSQRLYYAEGPGTPCWNGNVSAMSWSSPHYLSGRLCGYLYSYDRLNRLTEATYGENTTLLSNPNRYTERVVEYSSNGAMKRFQRHGLKNDGVYGKIDNLHITLNGNRIASVIDDAGYVTRAGANDFRQGTDNRMTYNAAGALLSDGNRGIARIDYDRFGRPRRAQFTSGSLTEWVYTAAGDKIRTIHTTVADGVTVPLGGEVEITPAMVLHSDTTEYAGEFVWENGRIKRALYPGGFASYDDAGNCTFNYYTADHVGNVRAVTDEYGMVVQRTDYYPFGSVIADRGFGSGVQPYKTAGKETDLMHGLDVADFGARLYNPTLPQWDRPDQYSGTYPWFSPYIYCGANPVIYIDEEGDFIETVWDIANVIYDVGGAVYYHAKGDHEKAVEFWIDGATDVVAAITPGVPAGVTKAARAASKTVKLSKAAKTKKSLQNMQKGRDFESKMLEKAYKKYGEENVGKHVRVVPKNGKGNVKGNRSDVDQLIKNDDGTFTAVEVKLRETTPMSKGQKQVLNHIEKGDGTFELRSNFGKNEAGEQITIREHIRINKNGNSPIITKPKTEKP